VTRFGDGYTPNVMRQAWLPATPAGAPMARAIVREATAALGLDSATTWELTLAATEAFANAVEHGAPCEPRGIQFRVETEGGRIEVEVVDCGGCFPDRPRTSKPSGDGGRGLPIIAAIVDHLEVVPDHGTTRVRFEKRFALV
jgi:serine/threonine-protein kinase RsbW